MQIGKKVYYEKLTGNVILEIGERQGNVVETTTEQDFSMYAALQAYIPESVGCIQLAYGQYADKFGINYYSINTATNGIVWGELINPGTPAPTPTTTDLAAQIAEVQSAQLDMMLGMVDINTKLKALGGI